MKSSQFHRELETVFGEEIEALNPDQKGFLIDLHEIAHLVLCHNPNRNNSGPMGQETEIDLTEHEWE